MRFVRRLVVIVAGWLCGVAGLLVVLPLLFALASLVPAAPGYWNLAAAGPALLAGAPLAGLFLAVAALVLSALPVLAVVVLAEAFAWRSPLVFALPGALIAGGLWWNLSPRILTEVDAVAAVEIGLFALAGAVAGTIYWAIAGRHAGAWRAAAGGA